MKFRVKRFFKYLHIKFLIWKNKKVRLQAAGSDQWGNIVTGTELIQVFAQQMQHLSYRKKYQIVQLIPN